MILFNVSYIDADGLRKMVGPRQGRYMKPTRKAAEEWLAAFLENNGKVRLTAIYGPQAIGTFRVDAFDCYDHGDPKEIYVEEDEDFLRLGGERLEFFASTKPRGAMREFATCAPAEEQAMAREIRAWRAETRKLADALPGPEGDALRALIKRMS